MQPRERVGGTAYQPERDELLERALAIVSASPN